MGAQQAGLRREGWAGDTNLRVFWVYEELEAMRLDHPGTPWSGGEEVHGGEGLSLGPPGGDRQRVGRVSAEGTPVQKARSRNGGDGTARTVKCCCVRGRILRQQAPMTFGGELDLEKPILTKPWNFIL